MVSTARTLISLIFDSDVFPVLTTVPWDYPNLSNKSATTSPFTIVFKQFGSSPSYPLLAPNTIRIHFFNSRQCIFYEHRHSQLCDFRWKSRAFCWHTRALWTRSSLSSTVPVRVDDAQRRTASRAASDEQLQRVVLRQLIHRQRSALALATESRRRV